MSPSEAALLGLLQGLTEFLPVSSSGHLVLGQALLDIEVPGVRFEVAVHAATLLAVLWVYRGRVAWLASGVVSADKDAAAYLGLLALASLPAAAAGILAGPLLERTFERPALAAALLLVSGGFAWLIDRASRPVAGRKPRRERPGVGGAVAIGAAQALAILPGISRSGSTVAVGAWTGVSVRQMAEFSFLLSVPAVGGAALLQLSGHASPADGLGVAPLAVGFVAALASGVLAIRLFLRLLDARRFTWFAYYCWLLGGGYLVAAAATPGLR